MAYNPHTWVHKETITASLLNHMEQGIAAAGASVILTTTLTAGTTTVTITDDSIANADVINVLTSTGIAPISQSVSVSTYTAVFEEQSADVEVGIEVK